MSIYLKAFFVSLTTSAVFVLLFMVLTDVRPLVSIAIAIAVGAFVSTLVVNPVTTNQSQHPN